MISKKSDGSITSNDGKVLFYSWQRFAKEICEADNCFICGRSAKEMTFNREHILPNWMLRKFDLHDTSINLPNGETHRYGTYTIPCCVECNSAMSKQFEDPISTAFSGDFRGVEKMAKDEGVTRLFVWMALIFLKLHLKDRRLRLHLDPRRGDEPISVNYEWHTFHHLHCLGRQFYTSAQIGQHVLGTLIIMQLDQAPNGKNFDLASITDAQALYLRAGDLALFAVFNDAGASLTGIHDKLEKIEGALNPVQARELIAELAACNLHLDNRPRFLTKVTQNPVLKVSIEAIIDPNRGPTFKEKDNELVGGLKASIMEPWIEKIQSNRTAEENLQMLRENRLSFLFDDSGKFIATV
jgi:hypothetical protein